MNFEEMLKIFKTIECVFKEVGMNWKVEAKKTYDDEIIVSIRDGKGTIIRKTFYRGMEPIEFWKSVSQLIVEIFVKQASSRFISALWTDENGFFRVVFWIWTKKKEVISWYVYPDGSVIHIREEGKEDKVPHTYEEYLRRLICTLTLALEVFLHDND